MHISAGFPAIIIATPGLIYYDDRLRKTLISAGMVDTIQGMRHAILSIVSTIINGQALQS